MSFRSDTGMESGLGGPMCSEKRDGKLMQAKGRPFPKHFLCQLPIAYNYVYDANGVVSRFGADL